MLRRDQQLPRLAQRPCQSRSNSRACSSVISAVTCCARAISSSAATRSSRVLDSPPPLGAARALGLGHLDWPGFVGTAFSAAAGSGAADGAGSSGPGAGPVGLRRPRGLGLLAGRLRVLAVLQPPDVPDGGRGRRTGCRRGVPQHRATLDHHQRGGAADQGSGERSVSEGDMPVAELRGLGPWAWVTQLLMVAEDRRRLRGFAVRVRDQVQMAVHAMTADSRASSRRRAILQSADPLVVVGCCGYYDIGKICQSDSYLAEGLSNRSRGSVRLHQRLLPASPRCVGPYRLGVRRARRPETWSCSRALFRVRHHIQMAVYAVPGAGRWRRRQKACGVVR